VRKEERRGLKVLLVLVETLELKALDLVQQVLKERQVYREERDHKVLREPRVHHKVLLEHRVHKVTQDQKTVQQELKVLLVHRVQRELKVQDLVLRVHKVRSVVKVLREHKVRQENKELQVQLDLQALKVLKVLKVHHQIED